MVSAKGFTLAELLIVVLIIGILSAIALPSMLSQIGKAKATEAKTAISSINKAQAVYRMEKSRWARSMDELGLGLPTNTKNYSYAISSEENKTIITARAKDNSLHGYSGGTVQFVDKSGQSSMLSIICENKLPGVALPEPPTLQPNADVPEVAASCNEGQNQL